MFQKPIRFSIKSSDQSKIFINGKQIHKCNEIDYPCDIVGGELVDLSEEMKKLLEYVKK